MRVEIIEDHDEALLLWRKLKVRGLDLVHVDAHIDFDVQLARSPEALLGEAASIQDLKKNLEYYLAFTRYEKDLEKQNNIGNYIYPAMRENIVRDFWWVVPGDEKEFLRSRKLIKQFLKNILTKNSCRAKVSVSRWLVSAKYLDKNIKVCCLERLPRFRNKTLLDIDADFLVIDSVRNADNIKCIGKRRPWMSPEELVKILKNKILNPKVITIARSTEGGYTPMKYSHIAEETAWGFSPREFAGRFLRASRAARHFSLFEATGSRKEYEAAVGLAPNYRSSFNNNGPLHLLAGRFEEAYEEFLRVKKADPTNPGVLSGLGRLSLRKKAFARAKTYFSRVLGQRRASLFKDARKQSLFGLGRAYLGLKNYAMAKEFLLRYKAEEPLNPNGHFMLGRIFKGEKKYKEAIECYKDAVRTGFGGLEALLALSVLTAKSKDLNLCGYLAEKYRILKKQRNNKPWLKKNAGRLRLLEKRIRASKDGISKAEIKNNDRQDGS